MSRVEPLNYFRQAAPCLRSYWMVLAEMAGHQQDVQEMLEWLSIGRRAVKFVLPDGGRILDDDLRGIPRMLRLPFPEVMIEYHALVGGRGVVEAVFGDDGLICPRRIVVALQDGEWVEAYVIIQEQTASGLFWRPLPYAARMRATGEGLSISMGPHGPQLSGIELAVRPTGTIAATLSNDWVTHAVVDLSDETRAVLELIEALTCSNVSHAALDLRKPNKSSIRNGALPFDEYRTLVINAQRDAKAPGAPGAGSNRSPREHLRRGHIRRISEDRTVWVNATVVAAGSAGQLSKSYMVRNPA